MHKWSMEDLMTARRKAEDTLLDVDDRNAVLAAQYLLWAIREELRRRNHR